MTLEGIVLGIIIGAVGWNMWVFFSFHTCAEPGCKTKIARYTKTSTTFGPSCHLHTGEPRHV